MSADGIAAVFFDLGDTLVLPAEKAWVPGASAALDALRDRSIRLGIISNTGNLTRNQLSGLLPADFRFEVFEAPLVVLSSEVGLEKPAPEIFAVAVARAGLAAPRCLYCGENLGEVLAAQAVGMRAARLLSPPHSDIAGLMAALVAAGLVA